MEQLARILLSMEIVLRGEKVLSRFKNRQEFEEWTQDQFIRYDIRQPDTYTEHKLIDLTKKDKVTE